MIGQLVRIYANSYFVYCLYNYIFITRIGGRLLTSVDTSILLSLLYNLMNSFVHEMQML